MFIPLLLFVGTWRLIDAGCPFKCNGNGVCYDVLGAFSCVCFPGFHGPDCSIRLCPSGEAWVDYPVVTDVAHNPYAECSNMGNCNRDTGKCECRLGFSGAACEQMSCPLGTSNDYTELPCSGHGRCMSLSRINSNPDFVNYFTSPGYSGWDADRIMGCVCEEGWNGVDCSMRSCLKGDDPITAGVNAVMYVDCTVTTSLGGLVFKYMGKSTPTIPYDATAELIEYHFERLFNNAYEDHVAISIVQGSLMCTVGGSITMITFQVPSGPALTTLTATAADSFVGTVFVAASGASSVLNGAFVSVTGTKEYATCSNHGLCNTNNGTCSCYPGFRSSNGKGASGNRPDCGFQFDGPYTYLNIDSIPTITTLCPVSASYHLCSGHGTCASNTCTCSVGYEGPACDRLTCSSSVGWFGAVGASHVNSLVCGGVGDCDYSSGLCTNCGGNWGLFTGSTCNLMTCPYGDDEDNGVCNGNGTCSTLQSLATLSYLPTGVSAGVTYTTPWDATKIRGCACLKPLSHDNQFFRDYDSTKPYLTPDINNTWISNAGELDTTSDRLRTIFYRPPFAYSATPFQGYNCMQMGCPTGDNPRTRGLNEIQMIHCTATSGYFTLLFRGVSSMSIPFDASASVLQYRLEQMFTLRKVLVTISGGSTVCTVGGTTTVYIEFLSEYGNLPLLTLGPDLSASGTAFLNVGYAFTISEYQPGSRENVECSQHGICNTDTGVCRCMNGFNSSADVEYGYKITMNGGSRGDCGYESKISTRAVYSHGEYHDML